MKTRSLYLSCHSALLSHWLVSWVTLCLFQVCRGNCGVCVREWNQTCCFSCRSVYHLLNCRMKLRQGKVSGVCMCYGRETDILCRSLSASLFQLISPQVSTACECILESFLRFLKQFRMPCEFIISLQMAFVTSISTQYIFVASKRDTLKLWFLNYVCELSTYYFWKGRNPDYNYCVSGSESYYIL